MAFNDPRTIPSGWAPFTDPQTAGRQAGNRRRARSARKAQIHRRPGQEQGCAGGAAGPLFDPFPSPNTIPAGWDLMEME